jgi:sugar lactone lactonase YvrE
MSDIIAAVRAKDSLGEGPIWDPRHRCLWWVNINGPELQSYDPVTRAHRRFALPGTHVGSFALRASGGLVLSIDRGLSAFDPASGICTPLLTVETAPDGNRLNDGRCDRRGRFWVGTMGISERGETGSLYRIGADRQVARQFGGVVIPNSTAFSPDDRTMYFADTPQKKIWAYDFDIEAGTIANRRVFVDMRDHPGYPDGSCVDADGYLWNAEYGGGRVVRYSPDGKIDRVVKVPASQTTCCAFGGDTLRTLFITSATQRMTADQLKAEPEAGALFAVDIGVRGLPEAMFKG